MQLPKFEGVAPPFAIYLVVRFGYLLMAIFQPEQGYLLAAEFFTVL